MVRKSAGRMCILSPRECRLRSQDSETVERPRGELGASLVEFALSAMVLLTFLFGIMAMCTALYSYHFVAEAAREGARYAIVRGSSCATYGTFTSNCPLSTTASPSPIQTYLRSLNFPGINMNNLTATAAWSAYPTGGTCTPLATCNNPGNQVQVTVSYQYPLKIPFVPSRTLTMTSRAQMVIAD
jgi:Flp pilus assembly protein TadG